MLNRSLSQRLVVLLAVAAVALGGVALPASARPGKGGGRHTTADTTAAHTERAKGRSAEAKARKAARFVVVGFVTAVDTDEVSLQVKAGHKAWRGTIVKIAVPADARVKRNDDRATAGDLVVGDHAMAKGAVVGGVMTARKVNAHGAEAEDTTSATGDALTDQLQTESGDDQGSDDASDGADDSSADSADTTTETTP